MADEAVALHQRIVAMTEEAGWQVAPCLLRYITPEWMEAYNGKKFFYHHIVKTDRGSTVTMHEQLPDNIKAEIYG